MSKIKLPSWLSVVLGAIAGILGGLNVATFGFGQPWSELVTFSCTGIAALGIAPLTHDALRNALHIPYPFALSVAGMLTTVNAGITATHWSNGAKGICVGLLTATAGALAGPEVPTPAKPTPAPEKSVEIRVAPVPPPPPRRTSKPSK